MAAPFLEPPSAEDSMELSSPASRVLDDEIEIDFDSDLREALHGHDEYMEDGTEQQDQAVQDEDMLQFDDENVGTTTTTDPQRFSTIPDEDLIDYSDDEEEYTRVAPAQAVQNSAPDSGEVAVESINKPVTASEQAVDEAEPQDTDPVADEEAGDATVAHDTVVEADEHPAEKSTPLNATAADFVPADLQEEPDHADVPEEGDLKPRVSTTSFVPVAEGPGTPTDTGLHPVTLYYADQVYPLFRTRVLSDGLLKDDNLASISLADLIKACRQSLIIRTQQEIDEGLELVLTFDDLALSVSEDAPASFQVSLQEILDVYVQLQTNDGHESHAVPPLDISCSLQIKFNNSIAVLRDAARRGEGLSAMVPSEAEQEYDEHEEQEHGQYEADEAQYGQDPSAYAEEPDEGYHAAEQDDDEAGDQQPEHVQDELDEQTAISVPELGHDDLADDAEQQEHDHHYDDETEQHEHDHQYDDVTEQQEHEDHDDGDAAAQNEADRPDEVDGTSAASQPQDDSLATPTVNGEDHAEDEDEQTLAGDSTAEVEQTAHNNTALTDADDAQSELEFDLEDYDQPEPAVATPASTKRQRESEDSLELGSANKKIRPT